MNQGAWATDALVEDMAPPDNAPSENAPFNFQEHFWLARPWYSTKFGEEVLERFNDHIDNWHSSNLGNAIWKAYRAFYAMGSTLNDSPTVSMYSSGDSDELLNLDIAHFRELINRQMALTLQARPAWEPQARTSDAEAMRQVPMARNLLDYDMQFSPLQDKLAEQFETAKVCASAYLVSGWNPNTGLDGRGWFTTRVLAPWEMAHERVRDYDAECTWWIFRAYESRWEWVARYAKTDPKKARAIFEADASNERFATTFLEYNSDDVNEEKTQDRLPVLYAVAKPTLACPSGRLAIVTVSGLVLLDGPHPYGDDVTISRLASSTYIGTSVPFADAWTLLAPCEAYNGMMSAAMTRVDMGAVPNVSVPTGTDFQQNDMGGANLIEVPIGGGRVELIDLLPDLTRLTGMMEHMKGDLGDLSGINAAVRGDSDAASSGSHAALMQSLAVQFNSRDERAYALNMERIGTHRLRIFQTMASEELLITVCGSDHAWTGAKFKGEDLRDILKVSVKIANPLQKTVAGKLELAKDLLQSNAGITPADYIRVAETGTLEDVFAGPNTHINLIKSENEKMQKGEEVQALVSDNHPLHVREHLELLTNDVRYDQKKLALVMGHIQQHIQLHEQLSREAPDQCLEYGYDPLPAAYAVGQSARAMESMMMGAPPPQEGPPPAGPKPQKQPNTEERPKGAASRPGPAPAPPGKEPSQAGPSSPRPSKTPSGEPVV